MFSFVYKSDPTCIKTFNCSYLSKMTMDTKYCKLWLQVTLTTRWRCSIITQFRGEGLTLDKVFKTLTI